MEQCKNLNRVMDTRNHCKNWKHIVNRDCLLLPSKHEHKKQRVLLICIFCILIGSFFFSCKKDNNDVENPTTKEAVYAVDISTETDWDYMLVGDDGSSAFVKLDENNTMPSHLFFRPDKNSDNGYAMFFQENGLLQTIVIEDYLFYFGNFKGTKFDMAIVYPDESIKYFFDINSNVNWNNYTDISKRNIAGSKKNGVSSKTVNIMPTTEQVGNGLSIAACVLDAAKAGNLPTSVLAGLGCSTTLISVTKENNFEEKVTLTSIGTAATLIGCVLTGGAGCIVGVAANAFNIFGILNSYDQKITERLKEVIEEQLNIAEVRRPFLIVLEPSNIEIPYPQQSGTINVITQSPWEIDQEDMGWCVAKKSSLYNKIEIEVKELYTMGGSRSAYFMVCPQNGNNSIPCAYFTVTQIGFEYTISPSSLSFKATGGQSGLTVSIPPKYPTATVESVRALDNTWCHVSKNGASPVNVMVKVDPNEKEMRSTLIEVVFKLGEYRSSTTVSVSQEGKEDMSILGKWSSILKILTGEEIMPVNCSIYIQENGVAVLDGVNGTWKETGNTINMKFVNEDTSITLDGTISNDKKEIKGNYTYVWNYEDITETYHDSFVMNKINK